MSSTAWRRRSGVSITPTTTTAYWLPERQRCRHHSRRRGSACRCLLWVRGNPSRVREALHREAEIFANWPTRLFALDQHQSLTLPERPPSRARTMTRDPAQTSEWNSQSPPFSRLCLPINRCNLPAAVLASLTFQRHPVPLELDGIQPHYQDLFEQLSALTDSRSRCQYFADYMAVHLRSARHPLEPWLEAETHTPPPSQLPPFATGLVI